MAKETWKEEETAANKAGGENASEHQNMQKGGAEKSAHAEKEEEAEKTDAKAEEAVKEKKTAAEQEASERSKKEEKSSEKPDTKDKKIDELTDKYKRLFAEFDNFRKRSEAEKAGMYADGERAVLEKILPVVDNFERAMENVPEEFKDSSYVAGVEKIYRSFADTLKALGVEPINAKGKDFDANLHNAVMHVEDENEGENIVVEELQKGYMFHDKVLRHSMVKVAN